MITLGRGGVLDGVHTRDRVWGGADIEKGEWAGVGHDKTRDRAVGKGGVGLQAVVGLGIAHSCRYVLLAVHKRGSNPGLPVDDEDTGNVWQTCCYLGTANVFKHVCAVLERWHERTRDCRPVEGGDFGLVKLLEVAVRREEAGFLVGRTDRIDTRDHYRERTQRLASCSGLDVTGQGAAIKLVPVDDGVGGSSGAGLSCDGALHVLRTNKTGGRDQREGGERASRL